MKDNRRAKRIGEEIKELLSVAVLRDLRDPRLPAILTVTEVRLSKDLRYATVFYTQMPDDAESVLKAAAALESSRGYLQSSVAASIAMRYHPELRFKHDASRQEFDRVENLLRKARTEREGRETKQGPAEDKSVIKPERTYEESEE